MMNYNTSCENCRDSNLEELFSRDEDYELIYHEFKKIGYSIIGWASTENTSGADLHAKIRQKIYFN